MVEAGVFSISYGQDETRDFQELSAASEERDPELDHWLRDELHAKLQSQMWNDGQTVYLFFPHSTSRSEYLVLVRVVSRLSPERRRPFREFIAVYFDRSRAFSESVESLVSSIQWDLLREDRAGTAQLRPAMPTLSRYEEDLNEQVGQALRNGHVTCERYWKNITGNHILYSVISVGGVDDKTSVSVATGIDRKWGLFEDFDVRVFSSEVETSFDRGSANFNAYEQHKTSELLLNHVPNSYLDYREAAAILHWVQTIVYDSQQKQSFVDINLLARMADAAQLKINLASANFRTELAACQARGKISAEMAANLDSSWSEIMRPIPTAQSLLNSINNLPQPKTPSLHDVREEMRLEVRKEVERAFAERFEQTQRLLTLSNSSGASFEATKYKEPKERRFSLPTLTPKVKKIGLWTIVAAAFATGIAYWHPWAKPDLANSTKEVEKNQDREQSDPGLQNPDSNDDNQNETKPIEPSKSPSGAPDNVKEEGQLKFGPFLFLPETPKRVAPRHKGKKSEHKK